MAQSVQPRGWVSIGPSRGKRSLCFAKRPDRMWGTTASYLFGAGSLKVDGAST